MIKACKTEADGRVVEGNHVVYRISAPSPEEKDEWMKSIRCGPGRPGGRAAGPRAPGAASRASRSSVPRASISRDPFYDMLATRKRRIANKK